MIKAECAGGIICNKRGQIVIISTGRGWALPKGHIEEGEDPLTTAKREIYEETGICELIYLKVLGSYERVGRSFSGEEWLFELKTIHMFLFMTSQEKLQPIDPILAGARWIDHCDVLGVLSYDKDKEFFTSILGDLREYVQSWQEEGQIRHIRYGNNTLGVEQ